MRRLRAQNTESNVDWDNGAAPITDIEGWRNSQRSVAEEERRKKMEAADTLHGYRGKEAPGMGGRKKDVDGKVFKEWEGNNKGNGSGGGLRPDNPTFSEEGEEIVLEEETVVDVNEAIKKFDKAELCDQARDDEVAKAASVEKESEPVEEYTSQVEEGQSEPEPAVVSEEVKVEAAKEDDKPEEEAKEEENKPDSEPQKEEEEKPESIVEKEEAKVEETAPVEKEPAPVEEPTPQPVEKEPKVEEPAEEVNTEEPVVKEEKLEEPAAAEEQPKAEEPIVEPEPAVEEPPLPTPPPTYSRTDVKFSFGLIVRSSVSTGTFDENLHDNETLRKCMASTSKILIKEMPSPPEIIEGSGQDYATFPKAYYDPTLEPTVLSIQEDTKDSSEMMEKGNKRTLVKASFPVFLQDTEAEITKVNLKETKSTVFKALRAAVSGGQFLR